MAETTTESPWRLTDAQKAVADLIRDSLTKEVETVERSTFLTTAGTEKKVDAAEASDDINRLSDYASQLRAVSERIEAAGKTVEGLLASYNEVAHKTSSLHITCEQLMADQNTLGSCAEDIRSRLQPFTQVDPFNTRLATAHCNVTSEWFTTMLNNIDAATVFLDDHPDYKESESYAYKYNQALSRALTHVRTYVKAQLKNAGDSVQKQQALAAQSQSEDDFFTLYYGVFAAQSPGMKAVLEDVERRQIKAKRNSASEAEYTACLADCRTAYVLQRSTLLKPCLKATVASIQSSNASNVCSLVRAAGTFLLRLCEDEYTLYFRFFSLGSDELVDFLEQCCAPLYDLTRPLLVSQAHLESLSELCSIIQTELLSERCGDLLVENSQTTDGRVGFMRVAMQLLADVQERLVYRAGIYAQTDIAGYNPASGDLAYPEKLEMMRSIAETMNAAAAQMETEELGMEGEEDRASVRSTATTTPAVLSPADLHGLWYPPVRRTIHCLSKLFRCLDVGVFQGISGEIISSCLLALQDAAGRIAQQGAARQLDSQLFLLKHLLILREQTAPFRAAARVAAQQQSLSGSGSARSIETQLDLGGLRDAARRLVTQRDRLFTLSSNNSVLEFLLQSPQHLITQHSTQLDSGTRLLDHELRAACQRFIQQCSTQHLTTAALSSFAGKLEKFAEMSAKDPNVIRLCDQPYGALPAVRSMVDEAYRLLKDRWAPLRAKLRLYLSNADTEHVLLTHIQRTVMQVYSTVSECLSKQYNDEERVAIALPTQQQLNILLTLVEKTAAVEKSTVDVDVDVDKEFHQAKARVDKAVEETAAPHGTEE